MQSIKDIPVEALPGAVLFVAGQLKKGKNSFVDGIEIYVHGASSFLRIRWWPHDAAIEHLLQNPTFSTRLPFAEGLDDWCKWFTIFSDYSQYVALHLRDKTTIHGWPAIWPSNAEKGHFLLTEAARAHPDAKEDVSHSAALVINVAGVVFVEFATPKEYDSE